MEAVNANDRRIPITGLHAAALRAEFVGELGAENSHMLDDIDPSIAERMLSYALGRGSIADIDSAARMRYASTILVQLAEDDYLSEIALNRFVVRARRMAEDW